MEEGHLTTPSEVQVRSRIRAGEARPADLADEHRQFAEVAASYAVAFAVGWPFVRFGQGAGAFDTATLGLSDLAALIAVVSSLGLMVVTVRRSISAARIRRLAPVYMVYGALWIALLELWHPIPADALVIGISWVCLWIIVYPLVAPGPKVPSVWAPILAASMGPLVLGLAVVTEVRPLPYAGSLAAMFVPNYIAAALSLVPTKRLLRIDDAQRMGSYSLTGLLGRGGMGEVWRAEHRLLVRPAAIKLLHTHSYDAQVEADLLERFQREAQATSELRSPHTVQLHDFGITEDGRMYYVMELLEGLDMEALVRRFGPLPPARVGHLLRQACLSLAEAHGAGLVHRDIKPRNLFVCRAGIEADFVKVLDFGLVRRSADPKGGDEGWGTPGYLAPEALADGSADARSDLYALGCLAFWLLTGRQVFERRIATMLALDHAQRPPPPPSRFVNGIPEELEALVLACLAKDPAARPGSAEELLQCLDAITWTEPWSAARAATWWEVHAEEVTAAQGT